MRATNAINTFNDVQNSVQLDIVFQRTKNSCYYRCDEDRLKYITHCTVFYSFTEILFISKCRIQNVKWTQVDAK